MSAETDAHLARAFPSSNSGSHLTEGNPHLVTGRYGNLNTKMKYDSSTKNLILGTLSAILAIAFFLTRSATEGCLMMISATIYFKE